MYCSLLPVQGKSLLLRFIFAHLLIKVGVIVVRDSNPTHLVQELTSFILRSRQQDPVGYGLVLVKNSIEFPKFGDHGLSGRPVCREVGSLEVGPARGQNPLLRLLVWPQLE